MFEFNRSKMYEVYLSGLIFLALKLDGEIIRFASDRIGGVNCSCRINKKSGPGKLAVFVDRVNFDDRIAAA